MSHESHERRASRASRRSRGAVVLETALVVPLVLAAMFSIIETSMMVFARETVEHSAADAARVASVANTASDADWQVLQRVRRRVTGLQRASVERIVIFRAQSPDASPSPACRAGASSGECSVYGAADLDRAAADLRCGWCPADRAVGEYVGVWISYRQLSLTGLFGDRRVADQSVLPLERPT